MIDQVRMDARVNDGRQFEERIFGLLHLQGVQALKREIQTPSKKIDIYFETEMFGSRRQYAVECKDYSRTLSQADLAAIKSSYDAVYESRIITDLLVVAPRKLSASAQSYVNSIAWLSFQTEADLKSSIINFRSYLIGVRTRFEDFEVKHYHVPSSGEIRAPDGKVIFRSRDDEDIALDSVILARLREASGPMIVLGDYGIGKTTLARQLFLQLHDEWEREPLQPLPIYISLELMQREQSLEGLLGTIFTSIYPCPGYNFDIFNGMNKQGYFILILDGIDEMRHKLNKEEFLFNIDQISTLSDANPRTVILGRPSAFMDEEEYEYTVKGHLGAKFPARQYRVPHHEVRLELLETKQIQDFVEKFCNWKYTRHAKFPDRVMEVIFSEGNGSLLNISRRPIQLMMLLDIFPELPKRLDRITKATVYSMFVDRLISREREKQRSKRFSGADQRLFGRKIAYWLWEMGGRSRIAAKQIDADLFRPFIRGDEDIEDVRRALVAGSFLSTEGGTRLHFPHRSIQEFLIAESIATSIAENVALADAHPTLANNCETFFTLEIVDFLRAQLSGQDLAKLVAFFDTARTLPRTAFSLVRGNADALVSVKELFERTGSTACLWILIEERLRASKGDALNTAHYLPPANILAHMESKITEYTRAHDNNIPNVTGEVMSYVLAMFILLSSNARPTGKQGMSERAFFRTFYGDVTGAMLKFGRQETSRVVAAKGRPGVKQQRFVLVPEARAFLGKVSSSLFTHKLEVQWVYKFLRNHSLNMPFPQEWMMGESIRIPGLLLRADLSHNDIDNEGMLRGAAREYRSRFS